MKVLGWIAGILGWVLAVLCFLAWGVTETQVEYNAKGWHLEEVRSAEFEGCLEEAEEKIVELRAENDSLRAEIAGMKGSQSDVEDLLGAALLFSLF